MKRLAMAVILALLTAAVCGGTLAYTCRAADDMTAAVTLLAQKEEESDRVKMSADLLEKWRGYERVMSTYARHSDIGEVTLRAAVMSAAAKGATDGEWELRCAELLEAIRSLREAERPTLKNIL